jgi:hypothetical protein
MNGDGVCETERRLAWSPGTTMTLLNLTGPRVRDPEDREMSLVPSPILTETGVVCLTSERRAEDVTMWWEAPESMIKMPGTEFSIVGTAVMFAEPSELWLT